MPDTFVLVVDDNPEMLNFLARALEAEGLKVRAVNSVFKALEALHDGTPRPAVIVTDLMMPRTTGWDFLKHLRSETSLEGLPVIVITGADPGEGEGMANLVLHKPIDPVHLAETVRSMMLLPSS
jgi:CheY-like chemotaxis protein